MNRAQTTQSRRWTYTLNNYTEDELHSLRNLDDTKQSQIRYHVVGEETGECGTPHLQGYIVFINKKRLRGVKEWIGTQRVHVETANGTDEQASSYCKKEGRYSEYGNIATIGNQGRRSDLLAVQASMLQGLPMVEIARNHFPELVRYPRGLQLAWNLLQVPRNHRTQAVYVWGRTGTGKTTWANDQANILSGGKVSWIADPSLTWFEGYDPSSKCVVIDEFAGEAKLSLLLRLLDRSPLDVPIKGGFVCWRPRIVFFTSNYSLDHWYGTRGEHYNALLRRIDEIKEMN